ncbi:31297_t:CDS:1, partial [Racocetra persica]
SVLYKIKKIIEFKDLKEDIAIHAIKKVIEGKDPNEEDWYYGNMAPVEN